MKFIIPFAAVSLLPTALSAQQASYTYLDQPARYDNWHGLRPLNLPRAGQVFQLEVPSWTWNLCDEWVTYWLLTGLSNPAIDLGPLGIPSVLMSSGEAIVSTLDPSHGAIVISYPIPSHPGMLGMAFYQQLYAYSEQLCVSPTPYQSLSRAGRGVIGL
jgi:hypothetical protein